MNRVLQIAFLILYVSISYCNRHHEFSYGGDQYGWYWSFYSYLFFICSYFLNMNQHAYRYKFVISTAIKKLDKQWNIYSRNILFSNHFTLAPKEMGVYFFILVCLSVCLSVINILSHFSQQLIIACLMYLFDFLFNADF